MAWHAQATPLFNRINVLRCGKALGNSNKLDLANYAHKMRSIHHHEYQAHHNVICNQYMFYCIPNLLGQCLRPRTKGLRILKPIRFLSS